MIACRYLKKTSCYRKSSQLFSVEVLNPCFFSADEVSLNSFITLLRSLHHYDVIQIKTHLDYLEVEYFSNDETEYLRNLLKRHILIEILKAEDVPEKEYYVRCLQEMNLLTEHKTSGYPCQLVGCKFVANQHSKYVLHVKKCHPNIRKVKCNFKKLCLRNFDSIEALRIHAKEDHYKARGLADNSGEAPSFSPIAVEAVGLQCKCTRLSCGGFKFNSVKELMKHYNSFHSNENRPCIFDNCSSIFNAASPTSAINHFRIQHKMKGKIQLKRQ